MKKFFSSTTNIILTVLLVAAIAVASILVLDVFKKDVVAIDFSNYTETEIQKWAKDNEVEELIVFDYQYDEIIENGKVIYQSVKDGNSIKDGINITISLGKDPNALINLIEINDSTKKEDIEKWISDNGLTNVYFQYKLSDKPIDNVININKNNPIKKDEEVIVSLSCNENEDNVSIVVPDFSNLTKDDISLWASGYGIKVDYVYKNDSGLAKDTFISQTPIKYSNIKNETVVEIVLAGDESNNEIIVPDNLLWTKEEDFINTIENLGLKASKQSKTYKKNGKDNGTIYAYDSSSDGIKFKSGDSVKYWLVDNGNNDEKIIVGDDYLGMDETKFIETIKSLGLEVSKQSSEYSSKKYGPGTIYAYDSTSDGINFKKGDTVKYWLVKGGESSEDVIVPDDYLGMDEKTFISKIEALGLKVSKQSKTYSSLKYKANTIYAYDSSGDGIKFKKGDTVRYWLVTGSSSTEESDNVNVPDNYLGLDEKTFISNIEALGLKASKQAETYNSQKYKANTIYAYDSSGDGIKFKKGDTVRYWLVKDNGSTSGGGSSKDETIEKVTLSNLVNSSKNDAMTYCSNNGLIANFTESNSSSVASGNIISMNPGAGSSVNKGSTVNFVVSIGEKTAWLVNVDKLASIYGSSSYNDTVTNLTNYFNDQGFTNYSFTEDLQTSKSKGVITGCTVNNSTYSQDYYPLDAKIVVTISNRAN